MFIHTLALLLLPIALADGPAAQEPSFDSVYKELQDFKAKGVPYSFQVAKYIALEAKQGSKGPHHDLVMQLKSQDAYAPARKQSCTTINNLKPPLSMKRAKSQDSMNWCFDMVASDLVAHATGEEPSAAFLGLNNLRYFRNEGEGFIAKIVDGVKKHGSCMEKDLSSYDYKFAETYKGYDVEKLVAEVTKLYHNIVSNKISVEAGAELYCQDDKMRTALEELFPNVEPMDIIRSILKFNKDGEWSPLATIASNTCTIKKIPALNSWKPRYINRLNQANWSKLDKALADGAIVGIEYDAGILESYNYAAHTLNGHASSLIGREWNDKTQSCDYILRNSWGKSCAKYSKDYRCVDGHVYIPETFFQYSPTIKRAVYLENKR
jgi:hypothetical protein